MERAPRDRTLPGLEEVRNKVLDDCCANVADIRHSMADLRADEAGYLQTAHREMRDKKLQTHRGSGVEFVRVPGEEKLRVRTSKESATAETAAEPEGQGHEFDEEREHAVEGLEGDGYDESDEGQSIADA